MESKEETIPDLEQQMAEQDCEMRNVPQDTQQQTEDLNEQIKMLQEQLQEVSISELLYLFLYVTQFYWEKINNKILSAHLSLHITTCYSSMNIVSQESTAQ